MALLRQAVTHLQQSIAELSFRCHRDDQRAIASRTALLFGGVNFKEDGAIAIKSAESSEPIVQDVQTGDRFPARLIMA
ncbi:hypothetical protein NDI49_30360 [Trichocoleus sp. ST-U3]